MPQLYAIGKEPSVIYLCISFHIEQDESIRIHDDIAVANSGEESRNGMGNPIVAKLPLLDVIGS